MNWIIENWALIAELVAALIVLVEIVGRIIPSEKPFKGILTRIVELLRIIFPDRRK